MTKRKYIEENIEDIIKLKSTGMYNKDIASKYGVSTSTINRALLNAGEYQRYSLTEKDIQNILVLYQQGKTILAISKEYNKSEKTISKILHSNGINVSLSKSKQKYTLDENYFDSIDTPNKAYLLGWLWSDGHNCLKNRSIIISLQEQDKYILEIFNKELKSNRPIVYLECSKDIDYNRQNQYRLSIVNKHMSDTLYNIGMDHDKGLTARFPNIIPIELKPHFIRGYFDGDGYISKNIKDCRMNITGTMWFCEVVQSILKETLNVNSYITIPHNKIHKPTRTLYIAGRNQIRTVFNYLYEDAQYYLKRKHDIFLNQIAA